jgi:hypothetical protein
MQQAFIAYRHWDDAGCRMVASATAGGNCVFKTPLQADFRYHRTRIRPSALVEGDGCGGLLPAILKATSGLSPMLFNTSRADASTSNDKRFLESPGCCRAKLVHGRSKNTCGDGGSVHR